MGTGGVTEQADPVGPIPRWFVAFNGGYELTGEGMRIESRRKHVVDWLSPRGFWHVFAFAYDAAGKRWIIYDVNRGGTAVVALTSDQFDVWLPYMRAGGGRVLAVDLRARPRAWMQLGMWCVVAMRHLLGVRSLALRPVGLWRDLRAAGAEEVFVTPQRAGADAATEAA